MAQRSLSVRAPFIYFARTAGRSAEIQNQNKRREHVFREASLHLVLILAEEFSFTKSTVASERSKMAITAPPQRKGRQRNAPAGCYCRCFPRANVRRRRPEVPRCSPRDRRRPTRKKNKEMASTGSTSPAGKNKLTSTSNLMPSVYNAKRERGRDTTRWTR